jgi:hypothetical protein
LFLASSSITLIVLIGVQTLSDAATSLGFWHGPAMYGEVETVFVFLKVMVPMSLLAGVLTLVRDRLKL